MWIRIRAATRRELVAVLRRDRRTWVPTVREEMEQETAGLSNPTVYRNDKFSLMIQIRKCKGKRVEAWGR
jgi:hypothetical protein